MKIKTKKLIFNSFLPVCSQILRLSIGLVVSRLILDGFGSEYNGLLSSTTHLMSYLILLEAGISSTTRMSLYKAFANKDKELAGDIFSSSRYYYRRMSSIYFILVAVFAFVYPLVTNSTIYFWEIFAIVFIQGLSGVVNFAFTINITQLLISDGKEYINISVALGVYILANVAKIIGVLLFKNLIAMQALCFAITMLQMLFYQVIFKKKYKWLKIKKLYNKALLPDRGPYLIQQIGFLIFNATDTIVLSIFCGFEVASIYAVYMIVYAAIHQLTNSLRYSLQYTLGQNYTNNKENLSKIYDIYNNSIATFATILLSVAYILIFPFIKLYTANVTDVNYIVKWLPVFFTITTLLLDFSFSSETLLNIAGKAKLVGKNCLIYGIFNLILSMILVNFIGIYGVLIATNISLTYKYIVIGWSANKFVLRRSFMKEIKVNLFNFIILALVILFTYYIEFDINTIGSFVITGLIITPIIVIICVSLNLLINIKLYMPIIKKIKCKILRK